MPLSDRAVIALQLCSDYCTTRSGNWTCTYSPLSQQNPAFYLGVVTYRNIQMIITVDLCYVEIATLLLISNHYLNLVILAWRITWTFLSIFSLIKFYRILINKIQISGKYDVANLCLLYNSVSILSNNY